MDCTKGILPILWKYLDKNRHCSLSINVATIENELIISIINGNKIRRFKNMGARSLLENLRAYLRV